VTHVFELTPETLAAWCESHGIAAFASKQILDWVYQKQVVDPAVMSNLSKVARETLAREMRFLDMIEVQRQFATDGTQKLLLGFPEAESRLPQLGESSKRIECVMIPSLPSGAASGGERKTACVSSQVGCPVGCRFCASGLGGVEGNLSRGRIVEQVYRLSMLPEVGRISHVVFMGMGEPLANFANVTDAIRTLNAPWGLGISARRITVSTVGMPAAIRKLVSFEIPVTLALSLHAPNDELRRQIIPWAEYATIDELLDACDEYFQKTGREITLEYILLGGFNDQLEHARELAAVAKRLRANVNLIRYNEVKGLPFSRPATDDVRAFQEVLRERRVNVHIRASRGRDIAAACGQLRHEAAQARAT
jgi:23S rRNA (adenine2503-C2)-methyltransferase